MLFGGLIVRSDCHIHKVCDICTIMVIGLKTYELPYPWLRGCHHAYGVFKSLLPCVPRSITDDYNGHNLLDLQMRNNGAVTPRVSSIIGKQ